MGRHSRWGTLSAHSKAGGCFKACFLGAWHGPCSSPHRIWPWHLLSQDPRQDGLLHDLPELASPIRNIVRRPADDIPHEAENEHYSDLYMSTAALCDKQFRGNYPRMYPRNPASYS